MLNSIIISLLLSVLIIIQSLFAQDASKVDPKHYKVEFENDQVRVLRISYGPGEKSVMHEHPEGVVVYLSDAQAKFTMPDGKTMDASGKAGQTFWTPAAKHQPENTGDKPFEVIQVEMKNKIGGMKNSDVRKAIEAQNARFVSSYNRKDAAGVAAVYTENGTVLPPNQEMVQGRQNIQKNINKEFRMGASDLSLMTVKIEVNGSTVHEIGNYTIKIKPKGQLEMTDSGKYLAIWKQQTNGEWLIHTDTWNSSMPLPVQ